MPRRPYFFELFTLVNLALIATIGWSTMKYTGTPLVVVAMCIGLLPQLLVGVGVRSVIALIRRDKTYFRVIRTREWITDTLRLVLFSGLMVYTYGWIKLIVPITHRRLFDQLLWDLDRALFFGMSPTVFFLDLFHMPAALKFVDWSYANIFYVSTFLAFAYFLSEPKRNVRVAFMNGNTGMWIIAAWLYMLVPSIGPAYRFPDIWMPYEHALGKTQYLQALLMRNYQDVIRAAAGQPTRTIIRIFLGIAAFPSMHVAFQMYVFLWFRKLWTWGEVIFAFFVLAIFLGSMITGWHYLVDSLFGLLMGYVAYRVTWRMKDRAEVLNNP